LVAQADAGRLLQREKPVLRRLAERDAEFRQQAGDGGMILAAMAQLIVRQSRITYFPRGSTLKKL